MDLDRDDEVVRRALLLAADARLVELMPDMTIDDAHVFRERCAELARLREPLVTATGTVLADADLEALAREAEMGYDIHDDGTVDTVAHILLSTTDAAVWAHHFKDQFGDVAPDEYTMLTWFANAIETGRNTGRKETCPHEDTFRLTEEDDLVVCRTCGRTFTGGTSDG